MDNESFLLHEDVQKNIEFHNPVSKKLNDMDQYFSKEELRQKALDNSLGQKQKIALLRALNSNNEIFFFDEAFSNLDNIQKQTMSDLFLHVSEYTVVNITHHLQKRDYKKYDKIFVMEGGVLSEKIL